MPIQESKESEDQTEGQEDGDEDKREFVRLKSEMSFVWSLRVDAIFTISNLPFHYRSLVDLMCAKSVKGAGGRELKGVPAT